MIRSIKEYGSACTYLSGTNSIYCRIRHLTWHYTKEVISIMSTLSRRKELFLRDFLGILLYSLSCRVGDVTLLAGSKIYGRAGGLRQKKCFQADCNSEQVFFIRAQLCRGQQCTSSLPEWLSEFYFFISRVSHLTRHYTKELLKVYSTITWN